MRPEAGRAVERIVRDNAWCPASAPVWREVTVALEAGDLSWARRANRSGLGCPVCAGHEQVETILERLSRQ